jgi:hypothetical protein
VKRRRILLSLAFALNAAVFFAVGVVLRDTAQDWRDRAEAEQRAQVVRQCPYYVVLTRQGFECKRLMIFFELGHPMRPERVTQ